MFLIPSLPSNNNIIGNYESAKPLTTANWQKTSTFFTPGEFLQKEQPI